MCKDILAYCIDVLRNNRMISQDELPLLHPEAITTKKIFLNQQQTVGFEGALSPNTQLKIKTERYKQKQEIGKLPAR